MLRQDRHLAGDQRQLAVAGLLEDELHAPLADPLGAVDRAVVEAVEWLALGLQRLQREDDVVDGDRLAVVPTRLRPQGEGHPRSVVRPLDPLGDQAVLGERLVARAVISDLGADTGGCVALDDVRIEAVEGAGGTQPQ